MATALTEYLIGSAATTVTTAEKMLENASTGGSLTNHNTNLTSGTTGWVEMWSQGNATATTGAGSEPSPSGHGWIDDSTLSGQAFVSGTWTATINLETTTSGSFVCDIHFRAYQYSSGTYTLIAEMVSTGQTIISTSYTTFNVSATGVAASNSFGASDHLYLDCLLNITTNSTTGNVRMQMSSSTTLGNTQAQLVTPGYSANTTVTETITETATGTETPAVTQQYTLAETTTGSEALAVTQQYTLAETTTGSEAVTGNPQYSLTETATGTETLTSTRQYSIIETAATGIELVSAGIVAYGTVVETVTGSEIVTEVGLLLVSAAISETSTGVEVIAIVPRIGITESATGSETLAGSRLFSIVETATGTETPAVTQKFSISESGAGAEIVQFANSAAVSVTETATGSERVTLVSLAVSPATAQMQLVDLNQQYSTIQNSAAWPALRLLATVYYGNSTNNKVIYGELDALFNNESISQLHVMRTRNDVSNFLKAYEYATDVLADGPIAYYRMGESLGAAIYDIAGNNYTGTLAGTYTLGQTGPLSVSTNTAILYNGTGYAALPGGLNTANWTGITLEGWIKFSNVSFVNTPRIIANDNPSTNHIGFHLEATASGAGLTFAYGDGSAAHTLAPSYAFSAGTWYHIAVTYSGATIAAYVNGSLVSSTSGTGRIAQTSNPVYISLNPLTLNSDYFPGTLSELAIFNYALSAGRVAVHYNAGINP